VLGPILFLIFINNIDAMAHLITVIKKFADNIKLEQVIKSQADSEQLQSWLDRMAERADMWGMAYKVKKCKVMHIGARNPGYEYTMGVRVLVPQRRRGILV
jgi:hypothetical protein